MTPLGFNGLSVPRWASESILLAAHSEGLWQSCASTRVQQPGATRLVPPEET